MSTYLGYDVLEDEQEAKGRSYDLERRFVILDGGTGAKSTWTPWTFPAARRYFRWHMIGEAEVERYRAFVDARKGRAIPFWLPSFWQDFELAGIASSFSNTVLIYQAGYAPIFALGAARRHLYLINSATYVSVIRKATNLVNNGDGTETLTVDSNWGTTFSQALGRLMHLALVRLEDDAPPIHCVTKGYAYADLAVHGVPMEVPA